jgi:hypothetical protein
LLWQLRPAWEKTHDRPFPTFGALTTVEEAGLQRFHAPPVAGKQLMATCP